MALSSGSILGRYRIVERLGKGGMASVYLAEDTELRREVAIKVMHPHLQDDAEAVARFAREARSVAALRHPHILEIYDVGQQELDDGSVTYFVCELIKGQDLRHWLRERGRVLPEVAALIVAQIASALEHAHQRGIIHRDIKPENVMVADNGRLVLTDFGLARAVGGASVTETGATLGSPAYMSPEQARGQAVDQSTDLFSLGALFYELATGRPPFGNDAPLSVLLRIAENKKEPAAKLNPQLGRELAQVVDALMAPTPAQRPDAAGLLQRLHQHLVRFALDDPDRDLASFFADPGAFNGELVRRVVERTLQDARGAAEERAYAKALAHCDRVLAFEPKNEAALALVAKLPGGQGVAFKVGLGFFVIVGLAGGAFWLFANGRDSAPTPTPSTKEGRQLAAAVAEARVTDGRAPRGRGDGRSRALVHAADQGVDGPGARTAVDAARGGPASPSRRKVGRKSPIRKAKTNDRVRVAASSGPKDAGVREGQRPVVNKPSTALLSVRFGPFCDAFIDGRAVGRSPVTKPLVLRPGSYNVLCRNGPGGRQIARRVTLVAGQKMVLDSSVVPPVQINLALVRADAIRVAGKVHRKSFRLDYRPHHMAALKGGRVIQSGWVALPPKKSCTLRELPRLKCQ